MNTCAMVICTSKYGFNSHQRVIVRKYLEGHLVPYIARMTCHYEEAVHRYIGAFSKVRMLRDKMDLKGPSRPSRQSQSTYERTLPM